MRELSLTSLIELKPTLRRVIKIWFAYVWRFPVAYLVGLILVFPIGIVLGALMGARGYSTEAMQTTGFVMGIFIAVATTIAPLKFIIGKQFKEFQLVLVKRIDILDKPEPEKKVRKRWAMVASERRYLIAASLFTCGFVASTSTLLIIHQGLLSRGVGEVFRQASDVPTLISVCATIVSALGIISTAILAWRKDRREAREYQFKIVQLERELAEVREKSALPAPKENPK